MKRRMGMLGVTVAACAWMCGFAATAQADTLNCAGASSSTGSDTIAGPVYGSTTGYYLGVQGTAPDPIGQGGYVEVSGNGMSPAVYGSTTDGTSSVRVGQQPCVNSGDNHLP